MAKALGFSAVAVAASLAGCSPFGSDQFICTENAQCESGRCEKNGADEGVCVGGGTDDDSDTKRSCFGTGLLELCLPIDPAAEVQLPTTLDTSMSSQDCATDLTTRDGTKTDKYCVVQGTIIRDSATLVVSGARPLVLIASDTIEIGATLDLSSKRASGVPFSTRQIGAGVAAMEDCNRGEPPADHGGGAGGSLGGLGGTGGNGRAPGNGGMPGAVPSIMTLRGGCPGQSGAGGTRGDGGEGGGAVYLIARTRILIKQGAAINASGEGGGPGFNGDAGGGGGGSGGMIGLDAPAIQNEGKVYANGASGGEGSEDLNRGNPGPEPDDETASPAPSSNNNRGGEGGSGGAAGDGGPGTNGMDSGGGGGGSTGVIKTYGTRSGAGAYSPTPTS